MEKVKSSKIETKSEKVLDREIKNIPNELSFLGETVNILGKNIMELNDKLIPFKIAQPTAKNTEIDNFNEICDIANTIRGLRFNLEEINKVVIDNLKNLEI